MLIFKKNDAVRLLLSCDWLTSGDQVCSALGVVTLIYPSA